MPGNRRPQAYPSTMSLALAQVVRSRRVGAGATQERLAASAGVSESMVQRLERGHWPTDPSTLEQLLASYGRLVVARDEAERHERRPVRPPLVWSEAARLAVAWMLNPSEMPPDVVRALARGPHGACGRQAPASPRSEDRSPPRRQSPRPSPGARRLGDPLPDVVELVWHTEPSTPVSSARTKQRPALAPPMPAACLAPTIRCGLPGELIDPAANAAACLILSALQGGSPSFWARFTELLGEFSDRRPGSRAPGPVASHAA